MQSELTSQPSIDPMVQRRARIALVVLLILIVGGGVGSYFGWKAYTQRRDAAILERLAAEDGGGRVRRRPPPVVSAEQAQQYGQEMNRRLSTQFEQALTRFKAMNAADREAFVNRLVTANRTRWRQITETPPASTDPDAAAFLESLRNRLQRPAAARPARPPAATAPSA